MEDEPFRREKLVELARSRMPFGKYKGRYLTDLPLPYLVWFRQKGFPKGGLGERLQSALMIRENGLEEVINRIRKEFPQ